MAFGQTLGSKGMFSLLIFRNSWHNIHLSFSLHFQPLHLSLVAIAAAALPSFVLPNCLVYWTFLASFGFFGLVSTPMSQESTHQYVFRWPGPLSAAPPPSLSLFSVCLRSPLLLDWSVALFDISIWHIDCRYIDTFEKYRYRYRYR